MDVLTKELISLHGKEGLRAEQWFDLMIDDVLAGFGLKLTEIPADAVREVLFNLSGLYAKEAIGAAPFTDILGPVHMELVSRYHRKGMGQFFTPGEICQLLAKLNMGNSPLPSDRLTRICDPAVGAGGLMLAAANHIFETHGPEALKLVSFTGVDIDRRCARMFPCQMLSTLFLNQIQLGELVSYHGNALGDPADWSTYCHYSRADLPMPVAPADLPEVKASVAASIAIGGRSVREQMALF